MKILIIHTGTTGEVLFCTPLIRALRVQLDASVQLLTESAGQLAVEENPYLEDVIGADKGILEAVRQIRRQQFDCVFDLDGTMRSWLISVSSGAANLYRQPRARLASFLITRFKIDRFTGENLADQYLRLAKPLGIKPDEMRLECFIPYKYEVPLDWLPQGFNRDFVVFCISAPYKTRQLPLSRMIEVCDRINKPVILIGSEHEARIGAEIGNFFNRTDTSEKFEEGLKALNKKTLVYNACGKFNFHQEKSLIRRAACVFTFDSDYLPVASAFGKETYCIYGNTIPAFGRYPYHTRFTILEKQLPCRPCAMGGHEKCPLGHFRCMNNITMDFYVV
jgi:ADP-heptose:LPS heptosyltransferase